MRLSDLTVRSAKPSDRLKKLSDGGGLQLHIFPQGSKRWRLAYRFAGKQKTISFGVYPDVSLLEAREASQNARRLLREGVDPSTQRRMDRVSQTVAAANTFDLVADELLAKKKRERRAAATLAKTEWLLGFARPDLGSRPIGAITAGEVLAVLQKIEKRGRYESARRLRSVIGEVFRFAVATARATTDPTFALRGALTAPQVVHRAAITDPKALGGLLRAIEGFDGQPTTKAALQLMALLFPRPGELRLAEWSEFDLEKAEWCIPAARTKMRRPHRVPLPQQAIAILGELQAITGRGQLLFPGNRSVNRAISDGTLNAALRRLGYKQDDMTAHGFRATASTLLNEAGLWSADAIERALGHVEENDVRRAYARGIFWEERVQMANWWADAIDQYRSAR